MATNNLPEYQRKIDRRALSEADYFLTLMNAAVNREMLTAGEEIEIKRGCGELLAFLTERYTDGMSSSVTVETAQELLNSIYFLLGLGLKKFSEPDDAVAYLIENGVNAVYTDGVARQRELLLKAKRVYQSLLPAFNDYGCIYYDGTVRKALSFFFKKYIPDNHRLFAQDIVISADYTPDINMKPTVGVEFIKNYIEQLYCENAFCRLFSDSAVTDLLRNYDNHYEHVLFNVFELVFTRAIGRIICGEEPLSLEQVEGYNEKLNDAFADKSRTECIVILSNALKTLGQFVTIPPAALRYTEVCVNQTAGAIVTARLMGALRRIFS